MKGARRRYPRTLSAMTAYFQPPIGARPKGVPPTKERALKYRHSQKEGEISLDMKVKSRVLLFREIMAICEGRIS